MKTVQHGSKAVAVPFQSKDNETVGSFIPEYLQHPFMNRAIPEQLEFFAREHTQNLPGGQKIAGAVNHEESGPIVGAINPMMFQRLFDEALKITEHAHSAHESDTAHKYFSQKSEKDASEHADTDDHKVSTSMLLSKEMLKPFMGQATKKNLKDFFDMYKPKDKDKKKKKKANQFEEIIFEPFDNYEMTY